ncbi:protein giant-lens [Belonocnema kinseyi]|uniref:protein giant-lens n=1 Tax=Belonocnema kinseyi TaxID=2817044 RepID=UPI00143D3F61|nr:protein giant-lens [Belonocnema kinseyi]
MKGFVVFFFLSVARLPRSECKNLGLQQAHTEEKSANVNSYYTLDEKKQLSDVKKFQDVSIEIDLLDSTHPRREQHEQKKENQQADQIVIYQIGLGEEDLPECASKNQICSKVDLYGAPWVERFCRCPGGRACPSTPNADDGHTLEDRSKQYKFCEAVMRIPYCHYFKDVTWSLQPYGGPNNTTVQRVFCRCRPGGVPYLLRRDLSKTEKGNYAPFAPVFYFGCSPQSKMKCAHKEPCKLFTVKKRNKPNAAIEDVSVSALCQCSKGLRCPRKHTDPGTMPSRSYPGMDIKTYAAYCTPPHHSNRSEVFKLR